MYRGWSDHLRAQQLLPGHGAPDAAAFLRQALFCNLSSQKKGLPGRVQGPNEACPPYTPDFIKLVESYGGHGIRVEKEEDIDAAFAEAKKYKDVPVIIEFMIATDEIVLPMVKSGNPMSEMILK